jgi:hypothetical protein
MTLDTLIADLRDELRAETPMRLHSRAVPVFRYNDNGLPSSDTDEGGIGMPFTAAMARHIGHPDGWGTSRLGMSSIFEISDACSARHPTHRRPLFTRSLCSQLAFEVTYLGQSVDDLLWLHGMQRPQLEGWLTWALQHAAMWRVEQFMRLTREPGVEPPTPERRRSAA